MITLGTGPVTPVDTVTSIDHSQEAAIHTQETGGRSLDAMQADALAEFFGAVSQAPHV
jgi:hypothetical protein